MLHKAHREKVGPPTSFLSPLIAPIVSDSRRNRCRSPHAERNQNADYAVVNFQVVGGSFPSTSEMGSRDYQLHETFLKLFRDSYEDFWESY